MAIYPNPEQTAAPAWKGSGGGDGDSDVNRELYTEGANQ